MEIAADITGAAALLALAAVAAGGARRPAVAAAAAGVGVLALVRAHGLVTGGVIAVVLGTTAASALALVLPPRPRLADPLALAAGLGAAILLLRALA